jgi:hypothetical protein
VIFYRSVVPIFILLNVHDQVVSPGSGTTGHYPVTLEASREEQQRLPVLLCKLVLTDSRISHLLLHDHAFRADSRSLSFFFTGCCTIQKRDKKIAGCGTAS